MTAGNRGRAPAGVSNKPRKVAPCDWNSIASSLSKDAYATPPSRGRQTGARRVSGHSPAATTPGRGLRRARDAGRVPALAGPCLEAKYRECEV